MSDLPQGTTINNDRADVIYRRQDKIKRTLAAIIAGNHNCGRFDDHNWSTRAAEEAFGYIDRVLRHQRADGGRPANNGRK